MSQAGSLGAVDASRWVGVAAALLDYLHRWQTAGEEAPPVPKGTFAGARRFLIQVLEGADLSQGHRTRPEIPVMAGLSSWTIAIGVLTQLPQPPRQPEDSRLMIEKNLACLDEISSGSRSEDLKNKTEMLAAFFKELLNKGNQSRLSEFARAESPFPLR